MPNGKLLPSKVTMPWWDYDKPLKGVLIQPLHTHSDMMLDQLALQVAAAQVPEEASKAVGEGGHKPLEAVDGDKPPEEAGSSSNYAGKGGGKGDDKGLQHKSAAHEQKRGGWLPRMVVLVKAIKAENWDAVIQLAEEYSNNYSLKQLLDQADHASAWKKEKDTEKTKKPKWVTEKGWEAHKAGAEKGWEAHKAGDDWEAHKDKGGEGWKAHTDKGGDSWEAPKDKGGE